MNRTIRVAHFSDLHYSPKNLAEADRCFGYAVREASDYGNGCGHDLAIMSGDLFDHRVDLHASCVEALVRQVRTLAEDMPVLILQGTYSHDPRGSLNIFRHVSGRHAIHVVTEPDVVRLTGHFCMEGASDTLSGDEAAVIACLPSFSKAEMAGDAREAGEHAYRIIEGMAGRVEAARLVGIPTIFVSHGTVTGALTEHGVPMAGNDHEFTLGALAASRCSAVMLGHIHAHQAWTTPVHGSHVECTVAYPGSIGRYHYGERGEKGWLSWEVATHGAVFGFIPTPATELVQIDFDGEPDMDELDSIARDISRRPDKMRGIPHRVRVRWVVDEERRHGVDVDAIVAMFEAAGAAEVKCQPRILPADRTRGVSISGATSITDKLAAWAGAVQAPDPDALAERLAMMDLVEDDEALAAQAFDMACGTHNTTEVAA